MIFRAVNKFMEGRTSLERVLLGFILGGVLGGILGAILGTYFMIQWHS